MMKNLSDKQNANINQTILEYAKCVFQKALEISENNAATLVYLWEFPVRIFFPKNSENAASFMSLTSHNVDSVLSCKPEDALQKLDYHLTWAPDVYGSKANWFDEDSINFMAHALAHEVIHIVQLRDMTSIEVWQNQGGATAGGNLRMECYAEVARLQVKMNRAIKQGLLNLD